MLSSIGQLVLARPGALWLGLALLPILVLYFLRMRFRRRSVGSTFIWRELGMATSGGDALRRRSVLLLLLQVAAVALAALAAAGPSLVSRAVVEPGTAFVIDVSASMGTRDCPGPRGEKTRSRVEAAVEAASREIDALGDGSPILTFAASVSAVALLGSPTADKAAAKASLSGLASGSGALEEGPCADAIAAVLARAGGGWRARAFTDGGMDLGGERLSAAFGGAFGAVVVGTSGESVGVTGLRLEAKTPGAGGAVGGAARATGVGGAAGGAARATGVGSAAGGAARATGVGGAAGGAARATGVGSAAGGAARATFTLWNGHADARELRLRLTRNARLVASAPVRAEPGWSRGSLELEEGAEDGGYALEVLRAEGELEGGPGETSYLSVAAQRALSVLLVGRSDPFLKAALSRRGISYSSLDRFPEAPTTGAGGGSNRGEPSLRPDIIVAENAVVPVGTRANLLVFGAPPPDAPLVAIGGGSGPIESTGANHSLSRFVSWEGAQASAGLCYATRGQALVLATTGGKPSVVAWEKDGYRCLAIGIDLARSDLGLKSAFPVLLQNYLQWCAPRVDDQSAYTLSVGERARRLEDESFRIRGDRAEAIRTGPAVTIGALKAGLFEWETAGASGYLAVNTPPGELDAAPRPLRAGSTTAASGAAATPVLAAEEKERSRPLGAAVSGILAACLAAEWIAWNGLSRRRSAKAAKAAKAGAGGKPTAREGAQA